MNIRRAMRAAAPWIWSAACAIGVEFCLAGMAGATPATVTQRLEPAHIGLADAARLTIAESGDGAPPIAPPVVAGLEFMAVSQSQQIQSINGVTRSTTSVTYAVIPRHAGVFTIPGLTRGTPPVVLTVSGNTPPSAPANAPPSAPAGAAQNGPAHPPAPGGSATQVSADGMAFVRLRLSTHDLYVGQAIPVDIEVGTRNGFVASLNGPPNLNGDAFTLSKLSSQPQRTEETVDGKPFTVFTWHSALAAVKPGDLSLTMETPLTVRIRNPAGSDDGSFGGLDDIFNDPTLQNFFGGSAEKDVVVASDPEAFKVLPLPTEDQPADFSGAVGHFSVSSDLSDHNATVGDPLTLRLRITGTGNFDRVNTRMLHDASPWKTYVPTANFTSADDIGYRGEKVFEQPVIATQAGDASVPPLSFSYFDPDTRRYETARTAAVTALIKPASHASQAPTAAPDTAGARPPGIALRPDHATGGAGTAGLPPDYYRPRYVVIPAALGFAFGTAWLWLRRRDRRVQTRARHAGAGSTLATLPLVRLMDEASTANDTELFFKSARSALQRALASQWHVAPDNITLEDVSARLGDSSDVARVFMLADESAYSGLRLNAVDFQRWKRLILNRIGGEALS